MNRQGPASSGFVEQPAVCLPDWSGLAACLLVAVLVLALSSFSLSSLDIGYHVAYGNHFLSCGEIVDRDPFIYPEHAVPFVNANWGSQVVMALVHRATGANGLIGLRIALIATVFACIPAILRHSADGNRRSPTESACTAKPAAAPLSSFILHPSSLLLWLSLAWLLAALAGYERFSMRPELFSYAVISVMLALLTRGIRSWRGVAALGILQVFWVNLHSYFLVGLMMTGAWLVGDAASYLWSHRHGRANADAGRRIRLLAAAFLVQAAGTLVNPWHVHGATFPLETLKFLHTQQAMGGAAGDASTSAWADISEFQSPFSFGGQIINARTIHAYYALLAVAGVGLILLIAQGRLGPALFVLILLMMSTQMRRNIAQLAFAASPLAIGAIATWARSRSAVWGPRRFGVSAFRRLTAAAVILVSCLWIGGIWTGRFYYVERRITREADLGYGRLTFPEKAASWLVGQDQLKPRLFVDYFSSSNALLWLPERFQLFVDTNTFAVKDETLRLAFDIGLGKVPHGQVFDRYGINIVLLHCGPDTQVLVRNMVADSGNWALVHFDDTAVVFLRHIPEHASIIAANQITPDSVAHATSAWIVCSDQLGGRYYRVLLLGTVVNVPISLGWWESAAEICSLISSWAPDYFEAWHNLGVCHGNLGNAAARSGSLDKAREHWEEAVRCFSTVLSLQPDHREAAAYLEATRKRLELLQQSQ
jgi:hypothetical protein